MKIRLKALRINEGLSLESMAKILGVGKSTVSRWELGETPITEANFKRYCDICNVDEETMKRVRETVTMRKEK